MRHFHQQLGGTLIEALVVAALFAMGMVGLAQLQTSLAHWGDAARQHADAMRLARQKLASLRAYSQLAHEAGQVSFEGGVVSSAGTESLVTGNTTYERSWEVNTPASAHFRVVLVRVAWQDRSGPQALTLPSLIARHPPDSVVGLTLPANRETRPSLSAANH